MSYIERKTLLEIAEQQGHVTVDDIINEPAADVAPVRHGRWEERKEHIYLANGICKEWTNFYCSECDAPSNNPYDYCPNCGARMDSDGNGLIESEDAMRRG